MSEIWNLSEVCRCCHSSGVFKSLLDPFTYEGNQEIYTDLLRDVLGIHIRKPPFAASHTICDQCIIQLRFCHSFKQQVLACERKFQEYCKNELFNSGVVKLEDVREARDKTDKSRVDTDTSAKKRNQNAVTKEISGKSKAQENKATGDVSCYTCIFCVQQFTEKSKLQEHESEKHKLDALSCKKCELTFKSRDIRVMHMKKHNSTGNGLRCKHCDKYYGTEKALIDHINSHYHDDKYPCGICPKKFPYKHTLRRHKEWHKLKFAESHIPLHECNVCSMVFRKSSELRAHKIRSHKSQAKLLRQKLNGPFTCESCGKLLSNEFCLKRHIMIVHTGLKPYKCDLCNATFSESGGVNRHKRNVHGHKKKEMCNICNKLYTNVKEHQKVHTKQYKCEVCLKYYPAKNTLNRHIKLVHLGIRPFSCEQCNAKFRNGGLYRKHLRKVHNEETVKTESSEVNMQLSEVNTKMSEVNTDRIENICDGIKEVISRLSTTS